MARQNPYLPPGVSDAMLDRQVIPDDHDHDENCACSDSEPDENDE